MISSITVTSNDEVNLERYLKSVSFFAENIIIDLKSTDHTVQIARQLLAKVYIRNVVSFAEQNNLILAQAVGSWIVNFEVDEMISEALALEIKSKINTATNVSAFKVHRNFYFMGKLMQYGAFEKKPVVRVFKKSDAHYRDHFGQEILEIKGHIETLNNKLDYSYKSFDDFNAKLTHQSRQEAIKLYDKKIRPKFYHFLLNPFIAFFKNYFVSLGILDGKEGFILAYLKAFAVMKTYLFLWTMYRQID